MKILFVDAYFHPENISFTHLEDDIIEGIINAGHSIEIICPIPSRGVSKDVYKKYKKIKFEELYDGKVKVRRFWAPREGRNPIIRALRYFWCNFRQKSIGKKYKNIDCVFAASTPPTQGLVAGKIAKKLKCPFIYSLQDVFPDSLVTTGLTKKGSFLWKIGRKIEDKTYSLCSKIVVISNSIKLNLIDKGVDESKLEMIYNWVDTSKVFPVERKDNKLIKEYGINPDNFLVVYAGNFGAAQGADIVIKVAEQMQDYKDITFVVFGAGSEFQKAVDYVKNKHLNNVIIDKLLPQDRVNEVYSLGDVALITCKKGVGNSGMPSKVWSIMACNTPIIASFDLNSELEEVLNCYDAGKCVEPENVLILADEIINFDNKYKKKIFIDEKISKEKMIALICCVKR